ncbi:unnamed protein product [Angiostrongylus costaricensis]|uniref:Aa_trans domain-containing protein n=1 Tax=Angiostrongylus costaricensis TaxID=334426 RepID=A0A158PKG1_ANGCS|nr:unnamed protein product [Angiostrongylus costaricensis]
MDEENRANLTLINFLKGMIGPGCFSLPLAFREAGLWAGFVLVFITGTLTCVCMLKIVRCSQFLTSRNPNAQSLNYAETADEAFKQSFQVIRNYGHIARRFVNICVSSLVLGICAIYYIFVVDHTKEQLLSAEHVLDSLPGVTDFRGIVFATGSVIYSFEGQALVTIMYAACGFFGYITYGEDVRESITLNMNSGYVSFGVKVLLVLVVYTGYLIQLYTLTTSLRPSVLRFIDGRSDNRRKMTLIIDHVLRCVIVLLSFLLAVLVPNLKNLIPLVGVTSDTQYGLEQPILSNEEMAQKFWWRKPYVLPSCVVFLYQPNHTKINYWPRLVLAGVPECEFSPELIRKYSVFLCQTLRIACSGTNERSCADSVCLCFAALARRIEAVEDVGIRHQELQLLFLQCALCHLLLPRDLTLHANTVGEYPAKDILSALLGKPSAKVSDFLELIPGTICSGLETNGIVLKRIGELCYLIEANLERFTVRALLSTWDSIATMLRRYIKEIDDINEGSFLKPDFSTTFNFLRLLFRAANFADEEVDIDLIKKCSSTFNGLYLEVQGTVRHEIDNNAETVLHGSSIEFNALGEVATFVKLIQIVSNKLKSMAHSVKNEKPSRFLFVSYLSILKLCQQLFDTIEKPNLIRSMFLTLSEVLSQIHANILDSKLPGKDIREEAAAVFTSILESVQDKISGPYDSGLLSGCEELLVRLLGRGGYLYAMISVTACKLWMKTFAEAKSLNYSTRMKNVLLPLINRRVIHAPGLSNQTYSNGKIDNYTDDAISAADGRIGEVTPRRKSTPHRKRLNMDSLDDDSVEYIPITSTESAKKMKLTERQREMFSEKRERMPFLDDDSQQSAVIAHLPEQFDTESSQAVSTNTTESRGTNTAENKKSDSCVMVENGVTGSFQCNPVHMKEEFTAVQTDCKSLRRIPNVKLNFDQELEKWELLNEDGHAVSHNSVLVLREIEDVLNVREPLNTSIEESDTNDIDRDISRTPEKESSAAKKMEDVLEPTIVERIIGTPGILKTVKTPSTSERKPRRVHFDEAMENRCSAVKPVVNVEVGEIGVAEEQFPASSEATSKQSTPRKPFSHLQPAIAEESVEMLATVHDAVPLVRSEVEFTSSVDINGPIFPLLADSARKSLEARGIVQIRHLAALTRHEVSLLNIRKPRIETAIRALSHFARTYTKSDPTSVVDKKSLFDEKEAPLVPLDAVETGLPENVINTISTNSTSVSENSTVDAEKKMDETTKNLDDHVQQEDEPAEIIEKETVEAESVDAIQLLRTVRSSMRGLLDIVDWWEQVIST